MLVSIKFPFGLLFQAVLKTYMCELRVGFPSNAAVIVVEPKKALGLKDNKELPQCQTYNAVISEVLHHYTKMKNKLTSRHCQPVGDARTH